MKKYLYFYDLQERMFGEIRFNFATKFTDLNHLFLQLTRADCRLFLILFQAELKFKAQLPRATFL